MWPISELGEVGALGGPERGGAETEQEAGGQQRVELRVELGRHVGRVREHAHHKGPFHLQHHMTIPIGKTTNSQGCGRSILVPDKFGKTNFSPGINRDGSIPN